MLKRVSIQNFKSLKDVTLDLQKVNLLIGPNNSGKTNFLKALEFLKSNHRQFPSKNDAHLVFNRSEHSVSFGLADDSKDPVCIEESFDFHSEVFTFKVSNSKHTFNGEGLVPYILGEKELVNLIKGSKIYRPNPSQFIKPVNFSADAILLEGDCSNLIQFLFYINTNYKRIYQQIEEDLANCVGDIVSFSTPPVKVGSDSKLGLKFFGKSDEDYWAEDVSEGVLYFLSLLTIVSQPNPPKLLLLEEPEKGIHPRRIHEVIQFILRLSEEKDVQVIITTHSPTVVDMFADMPESVFIFDKDDEGATHVKNLLHDVIEPETVKSKELGIESPHYTDALGDAWTVGFLGGVPK